MDSKPYNDEAEWLGYESGFIAENSGSITIFICLFFLFQLLFKIVAVSFADRRWIHKFAARKNNEFFWAGFTNFLNEIYLPMAISVSINSATLQFDSFGTIFNSTYSCVVGLMLIAWPIKIALEFNSVLKACIGVRER